MELRNWREPKTKVVVIYLLCGGLILEQSLKSLSDRPIPLHKKS